MSGSYSLQWEPVEQLIKDGVAELLIKHWKEVALDQDTIPLDPDWKRVIELEHAKMLYSAALRRDGKIVGYNAFAVYPHIHYKSSLHAVNDVLYVDPEERGTAGIRLIRGTEAMLKELGVVKVIYHTKVHVPIGHKSGSVGDLLAKMQYKHFENLYSKMLG